MENEQKIKIVESFTRDVAAALIEHADQWPKEWDGIEMRWLVQAAFDLEAPDKGEFGRQRYRNFKNEWATKNLY
jgi:hypothetical protein